MRLLCGLCEKDIRPLDPREDWQLLCDKCDVRFAVEMVKRQGTFQKVSLF